MNTKQRRLKRIEELTGLKFHKIRFNLTREPSIFFKDSNGKFVVYPYSDVEFWLKIYEPNIYEMLKAYMKGVKNTMLFLRKQLTGCLNELRIRDFHINKIGDVTVRFWTKSGKTITFPLWLVEDFIKKTKPELYEKIQKEIQPKSDESESSDIDLTGYVYDCIRFTKSKGAMIRFKDPKGKRCSLPFDSVRNWIRKHNPYLYERIINKLVDHLAGKK